MKNRIVFSSLLVIIFLLTGCARFITRPEQAISTSAADLLKRVTDINGGLSACKGIGTISFPDTRNMPRMRFAWLCRLPDRIRLELLAPTGSPLLSLAADGDYLYFLPHDGKNKLRKKKAANINLEKVISVPLTISDASHLLTGAIPLREFDKADRIELTDGDYMLQLKRSWPDKTENIIFDKSTGRPRRIEFSHGSKNKLEYSASFSGIQTINEMTVPESIMIQNGRDMTVIIAINRFWPEEDLPVEKFILAPPP